MKPNILVFVTDQHQSGWLGCAGDGQLKTPNIDSIAENGVMFSRTYCNTPLCMPSRATLWTGLTPRGHGVRTNGIDLADHFPTLPGILKENGYQTISVGKIHLKSWHMTPKKTPNIENYDPEIFPECETPWKEGSITKLPPDFFGIEKSHFLGGHGSYCYGEYLNWLREKAPEAAKALITQQSSKETLCGNTYYSTVPEELYYTEWITEKTMECMDALEEDNPFFLWCSNPDPHFPFGPPAPWNTMYAPEDMGEPVAWDDTREGMPPFYQKSYYDERNIFSLDGGPGMRTLEQIRETKALVYGMTSLLDKSIGRVTEHLKKIGRYDNTIIIFVSDHGELMGDHGLFCKGPFHYENLIRVPFIAQWPGKIMAGTKSDALVSLLDFMPTVLDLAGIAYPMGPIKDWPGPFENTPEYKDGGIYKDIPRLPGRSLKPVLFGEKDGVQDCILVEDDDDVRNLMLRTLVTERYKMTVYMDQEFGELFDLQEDPEERKNLWKEAGMESIKCELYKKLVDKITATEPRLLRRISVA